MAGLLAAGGLAASIWRRQQWLWSRHNTIEEDLASRHVVVPSYELGPWRNMEMDVVLRTILRNMAIRTTDKPGE